MTSSMCVCVCVCVCVFSFAGPDQDGVGQCSPLMTPYCKLFLMLIVLAAQKVVGSIPREHTYLQNMYSLNAL